MDSNHIKERRQSISNNIFNSFNQDTIEKGGEGSKGGKVIGHTKSGKPIYESGRAKDYKDFTGQDHYDAAKFHKEKVLSMTPEQREEKKIKTYDNNHEIEGHKKTLENTMSGYSGEYKAGVSPQFNETHLHYHKEDQEKVDKHLQGKGYKKDIDEKNQIYYHNKDVNHYILARPKNTKV